MADTKPFRIRDEFWCKANPHLPPRFIEVKDPDFVIQSQKGDNHPAHKAGHSCPLCGVLLQHLYTPEPDATLPVEFTHPTALDPGLAEGPVGFALVEEP